MTVDALAHAVLALARVSCATGLPCELVAHVIARVLVVYCREHGLALEIDSRATAPHLGASPVGEA